jgi:hypothetical protein
MWKILCHIGLILIGLVIIRGFREWFRNEPLLPLPVPLRIETRKRFLFKKDKEIKLAKDSTILTLPSGFCEEHPEETRLVMGKINECYSCKYKSQGGKAR